MVQTITEGCSTLCYREMVQTIKRLCMDYIEMSYIYMNSDLILINNQYKNFNQYNIFDKQKYSHFAYLEAFRKHVCVCNRYKAILLTNVLWDDHLSNFKDSLHVPRFYLTYK